MPAPSNVDDLLKLMRKSGMVEDVRLDGYLERLKSTTGIPADVKKLAGSMVRDGLLTYFQAEQFMLGKWRGFTIGKYKLLERIGFGGMGQVFLCEHMYMRRRVAIKVLPPAKAEEPAALGRFYREARAAAALDHPNIVRTHDIDQDGNLHFLVMEYVDGISLLDLVKKNGPVDVTRATNYIWQSMQGLDHAFRVGVIHRDIKPGNILVDRFGVSKILDMGLARFYHTDDDMLTLKYDEKSVLGTADYVAPEQTVNSHEVDVRADIYSMGATFYFLLAGHPPFPDGTIAQKLIAHQTRNPVPIRQVRPDVPAAIESILLRMMAKSLDDRFQTPAEVYEAFLPYVQTQIAPPPEEEMPVLSPAARESLAGMAAGQMSGGMSGSGGMASGMSGSFRQDSAIYRANILMQQSGRMPVPNKSVGDSGVSKIPGGSSSSIRNPMYERTSSPSSGGSSKVTPAIPNPAKMPSETNRLNATEKTPVAPRPASPRASRPAPHETSDKPNSNKLGFLSNYAIRIMIETLLVLGCASLVFWIYSMFK